MCTSPLEKKERREEKRRKGKIYAQKFPRNEERDRLAFPFTRQLFQISKLFESRTREKERERERRSVPRRHEEEQGREEGRPETNDNAEDIVLKSGAT